jgi:hypothetical protein
VGRLELVSKSTTYADEGLVRGGGTRSDEKKRNTNAGSRPYGVASTIPSCPSINMQHILPHWPCLSPSDIPNVSPSPIPQRGLYVSNRRCNLDYEQNKTNRLPHTDQKSNRITLLQAVAASTSKCMDLVCGSKIAGWPNTRCWIRGCGEAKICVMSSNATDLNRKHAEE